MLEAERQFRRIIGNRDLAALVVAIESDLTARGHSDREHTATRKAAIVAAMQRSHRDRRHDIPRRPGHPPAVNAISEWYGTVEPFRGL
jgi:hypothetical protein